MSDLRLTDTLDLARDDELIDGAALIAQRAAVRLRTQRGEWPLDTEAGLPWREWLQQRPFPERLARAQIRAELANIPGVVEVTDFTLTIDVSAEAIDMSARVRYGEGTETAVIQLESAKRAGSGLPQLHMTVFDDQTGFLA